MSPQIATWNEISTLLLEARAYLTTLGSDGVSPAPPAALTVTLGQFAEFLEHNELELAWDTLAEIATRAKAPPACWGKLAHAARLMMLTNKADEAARRAVPAVSCDQALAIARHDAEQAHREFLDHRIEITLQSDGWHVEFRIDKPLVAGGGANYLVDATSGAILSKTYYQ
jgi:hypothetical protein